MMGCKYIKHNIPEEYPHPVEPSLFPFGWKVRLKLVTHCYPTPQYSTLHTTNWAGGIETQTLKYVFYWIFISFSWVNNWKPKLHHRGPGPSWWMPLPCLCVHAGPDFQSSLWRSVRHTESIPFSIPSAYPEWRSNYSGSFWPSRGR